MIQKRLDALEKAQGEYKAKKEVVNQSLQNDEELLVLEAKLKDSRTRYNAQKQAVLNEPENRKVLADLKDLAIEMRDTKQLLGEELVAYFMKNNSLEYVDAVGTKRRFQVSAKFVSSRDGEN